MIGPFETKYLLGAGLVVGVVTAAMVLLRGYLSLAFVLPLWMLVLVIVVSATIIGLLLVTIIGFYKWGREGFIFSEARKKGIPIYIDAELGSDNADFVLGVKVNPKDVTFADEESGVKLDPGLLSADARPMRFPLGLDVYICSYYNYMAQSIRNHAAFRAIETYFKTECQELSFLTIKEFTELISDPEHFLRHNAEQKLNKYFKRVMVTDPEGRSVTQDGKPLVKNVRQFMDEDKNSPTYGQWIEQDMNINAMIQKIAQARNDIAKLPIMGGLLAGTEAFKNNSISYSSQHLSHAFMLFRKKLDEEWQKKIDMMTYTYLAMAIFGGVAIILAIIFVVGPGAACGGK